MIGLPELSTSMVNKDDKASVALSVAFVVVLKLMPLVKSSVEDSSEAPSTLAGTEVRLSVSSSKENSCVLDVVNSSLTTL